MTNVLGCIPSFCKKWHRVIAILIVSTVIFLVLYLLNRDPLMIIEAQSRSLDFNVVNNEEARIAFPGKIAFKATPRSAPECLAGLFEPDTGSKVSYSLFADTLVIRASSGHFTPIDKNTAEIEITERSSMSYGPGADDTDGVCESQANPVQLPIWGPTSIGQTATPQNLANRNNPFTGTLIGGEVLVFGRNILGSGIYPAGEFSLPTGARLSSQTSTNDNVAPWWGYAKYLPSEDDNEVSSLEVSATTIASDLIMQRRGSGPSSEKIQAGVFAQVAGDPFCAIIITVLASIFFILEFVVAARELSEKDHA